MKKGMSVFLAICILCAVLPFCAVMTDENETDGLTFYAPETIYLDPATSDSTMYRFKYFVDSDVNGTPRANATQTSGLVHFSVSYPCTSVEMIWSGASVTSTVSGSGSTRTWTITGGSTTVRRGAVTVTVRYTIRDGGTYSVSRKVYLYMPRMNATVGVGGAYQYNTTFGGGPVTAATVLLAGLHKVGGGNHAAWTGTTGALENTSPLICMPSTATSSSTGEWPSGSAYYQTFFGNDSGYLNAEGDGYDAGWNAVATSGGGAKWCGHERGASEEKTWDSGVVGRIAVDISRNATMDTIPFLQGGWFVHYNTNSSKRADANFMSTSGNLCVGPVDEQTFGDAEGVSFPSYGTTPWHLTGTTPSASTSYAMRGTFSFRRSSSSTVRMYIIFTLQVIVVDKTSLRDAVDAALRKGYRLDFYTDSVWADLVNTLNTQILNACTVLGDPEAIPKDVTTSLSSLNSALSACDSYYRTNPHEHVWLISNYVLEPTCTERGAAAYICSICGDTKNEPVAALGHDFDDSIEENVTIVPPTADAPGSKTVKCSRCDAVQTEELPILSARFVVNGGRAYPGQTVQVTVDVQNNPGIVAALIKLSYDPAALTLIDAANGGLISGGTLTKGDNLAAIPFSVIVEDSLAVLNYTQDGALVVFTFRVKEDAPLGSTPVTVTYDAHSTFDKDLQDQAFIVQNGAVQIANRVSGDAGGDGTLDLKDVTILIRYLADWTNVTIDPICADVDGDGIVTLKDATLIRRYLAGWNVILK